MQLIQLKIFVITHNIFRLSAVYVLCSCSGTSQCWLFHCRNSIGRIFTFRDGRLSFRGSSKPGGVFAGECNMHVASRRTSAAVCRTPKRTLSSKAKIRPGISCSVTEAQWSTPSRMHRIFTDSYKKYYAINHRLNCMSCMQNCDIRMVSQLPDYRKH